MQRQKRQKGAAVVESAFIFLILFSMIIGIFDFGQFLFVHQALVERARGAARWGAIYSPSDSSAIRNKVLYNQATQPVDATGYFGLTAGNVLVAESGVGTDHYRLTVQIVNFPYKVLSPVIGGSYTGPTIRVSVPMGLYN
jgi:Flp pilus assembly protein TadG